MNTDCLYRIKCEHQNHIADTNRFPSFADNDSDVVYIIPCFAKSIEDLVKLCDSSEDLLEFLNNELGSGESVMTFTGDIFVGCDIFDCMRAANMFEQ